MRVYDPVAAQQGRLDAGRGACLGSRRWRPWTDADGVVLVTEWPEFREIDWEEAARRMRVPLVIDGRNFLDRDALVAAGFTYEGIGR